MLERAEAAGEEVIEFLKDLTREDILKWCSSDEVWARSGAMDSIRTLTSQGTLDSQATRALCWRLLLRVLPEGFPPSQWAEVMRLKRDQYDALKARHVPDISKLADVSSCADPLGAMAEPPRAEGGSNPWDKYYELQERMELIQVDLKRLFPADCGNHFMQPRLQTTLQNVLFVWSSLHPDTNYRQGMHELLAPLILVLEEEGKQLGAAGNHPPMLTGVVLASPDSPRLEADAFWLFSAIMDDIEGLYAHKQDEVPSPPAEGGVVAGEEGDESAAPKPTTLLQRVCSTVQDKLLPHADPVLHEHLEAMGISPQLYVLRWSRLLFVREVPFTDLLCLWDGLFAAASPQVKGPTVVEGVELMSAAIVLSQRDMLLAGDADICLECLLRKPSISDMRALLASSRRLWKECLEGSKVRAWHTKRPDPSARDEAPLLRQQQGMQGVEQMEPDYGTRPIGETASMVAEEMGKSLGSLAQGVAGWMDGLQKRSGSASGWRPPQIVGGSPVGGDPPSPPGPPTGEAIITAELGRRLRRSVDLLESGAGMSSQDQAEVVRSVCREVRGVAAVLLREAPVPAALAARAQLMQGEQGGYSS